MRLCFGIPVQTPGALTVFLVSKLVISLMWDLRLLTESSMGTHGFVTNNSKESLVTEHNLKRLANIPILFISGSENVVYTPEATNRSLETMNDTFGQGLYEREVFQGYGHLDCWMGKDAADDVYPTVLAHALSCMSMDVVINGTAS